MATLTFLFFAHLSAHLRHKHTDVTGYVCTSAHEADRKAIS